MVGVILGVGAFVIAAAVHLVVSHSLRPALKERTLVACLAAGLVLYLVAFAFASYAPATLAGVPRRLPLILDLFSGLCALGFLSLGYLEFWSLIERSFSLRILIDLGNAHASSMSPRQLAMSYGGGVGLEGMMEKRIQGLVGSGMVVPDGSTYRLTGKARMIGRLFHVIYTVLEFRKS